MASLISTNQIPSQKTLSNISIQNRKVFQTVKMNLKTKKHEQRRRVVKHSRAMAEGDHDQNGLIISTPFLDKEGLTDIDLLKKQLVDSFYGTNRGFCTSYEARAEITELISRVEAKNPNPAPTEALTLLNGKWILAYTSFHVGLIPLVSSSKSPPFMKIEEISQTIDSDNFAVQNSIVFSGPLATTSISTNATFQVRSPKRVQIKFEEGVIGTPQLIDWIVIPENVEILGESITVADLTVLKSLLTSVQNIASSVTKSISSQPPLRFPISDSVVKAESWLLTTYLDDELRISRDDGGSVFALIKEGSPLLLP